MSSENSVMDHSSEEVDCGVKGEVKMPAPEKIFPAKDGDEMQGAQVVPGPVAASSVEPEEVKKIEPLVTEKANEIEHGSLEPAPVVSNFGSETAENVAKQKETEDVEAVEKVVEKPEQTSNQDVQDKVVEKPDLEPAEEDNESKVGTVQESPGEPGKAPASVAKEVENAGESSVQVVEEPTPEQAVKGLDLPVQSSDDLVEKKFENVEEQPEKKGTVIEAAEHSAGEKVGEVEALPVKHQTSTDDVLRQSSVEEKAKDVEESHAKEVEAEAKTGEVQCETAEMVDDAHQSSVPEAKEEKTTEPELVLLHPKTVESGEDQLSENAKALDELETSSKVEKLEGLQEGSVSEVECKPADTLETNLAGKLDKPIVELVDETSGKPEKVDDVSEQPLIEVVKEKEELPSATVGKSTDEEVKASEHEEISKPVESVEETSIKTAKEVDEPKPEPEPETSGKEEKIEKVEESHVKETEAAKDSEVECNKPEDILETELTRKLEEPKPESIDETSDKQTKVNDISEQPLINVLDEKVEKREELPSGADHKPEDQTIDSKPAEPPVEEIPVATSKALDVPDQTPPGEKVEESHFKDVEEIGEKEVEVLGVEPNLAGKVDESKLDSLGEKRDEPTRIEDVSEQLLVKVCEDKEHRTEETSDPKPVESAETEARNLVVVPEHARIEESLKEVEAAEPEEVSRSDTSKNLEQPQDVLVESIKTEQISAGGEKGEDKEKDEQVPAKLVEEAPEQEVKFSEEISEKPVEQTVDVPEKSRSEEIENKVEKEEESKDVLVERKLDASIEKFGEGTPDGTVEETTGKEPPEKLEESKVEEKPGEEIKPADFQVENEESCVQEAQETRETENEVSELSPPEKLDESKQALVEEKLDQPVEKVSIAEELPVEENETSKGKEKIVPEDECVQETLDESKVNPVEEKVYELEKTVDEPKQDPVEEKVEMVEVLPVKEVILTEEEEAKVANSECELKETTAPEPAEPVVERKVEPEKVLDVEERSLIDSNAEKLENVEERVNEAPEQSTIEEKVETGEVLPVKDPECKLKETTESEPSEPVVERKVEPEKVLDVEECSLVDSNPEKLENVEEPVKEAPEQSTVEEKVETGEVLPVKETVLTEEEAVKDSNPECKLKEITEPEPSELVVERKVEPEKVLDVGERSLVDSNAEKLENVEEPVNKAPEQYSIEEKVETGEAVPVKEPVLTEEEVVKDSNPECKLEKITEPEPAEPVVERKVEPEKVLDVKERSLVDSNAEKLENVEEPVNKAPEQFTVEEKVETGEALPVKEAVLTEEEAVKDSIPECKLKEITDPEPAELVVERKVEPEKVLDVEERSLVEKLENVEEPVNKAPEQSTIEEKVETGESLPVKEVVLTEEEAVKDSNPECKLKEITEPEPAEPVVERKVEPEKDLGVQERSLVDLNTAKLENVEESVAKEPEETVEKEVRVLEPEECKLGSASSVEHAEKTQETASEPVKTRSETEAHEEENKEKPCETEDATIPVTTTEVAEKSVTDNISTKDETVEETAVEGNGDGEAEKSEGPKKKEEHGRSLKDKLEQEKHDYEASKTDVHNTESSNEHEDAHTEEVTGKSGHKHSNNIMKMVKHSLSKAKKVITGKAGHPKAPLSEVKEDETCK